MRKPMLGAAVAFLLAGCSTSAIDINRAAGADQSAYLDPTIAVSSREKGTIRIARDSGVYSISVDVLVYVDGRHVGNVASGRVLSLQLPPGVHALGVQFGNSTQPIEYVTAEVRKGENTDYRVSFSGLSKGIRPL